jgi:hypothetical protein
LLSLASSEWIVADVHFIAGIANDWLNPHMKGYQGTDANIGRPGFLSFHRSVRYFLMVDHVDQIRRDWKTNEVFEKFSKQITTMTNSKLKLLKEGMVEAFLKKMKLQIIKHNKRYVLTRSIVRSVFTEWQTGQAVVQVLKGGKGLPSLSPPFFSNQHDREINCEKFCQFLRNKIPLTVLAQLRTDPCIVLNQNAMNKISAQGLEIWDTAKPANRNTCLYRREALCAYAAHASTQHNNERLFKLSALMASTGKSEIMASVFAIASNDFIQEYTDAKEESYPEEHATINQRKRQQEERKTMMAPSDANEETEEERKVVGPASSGS